MRLTTYHYPVPLSRNLGTLTSWNHLGLSRPVMGLLYLLRISAAYALVYCLAILTTILICANELVITFIQLEYLFLTCTEELSRKVGK